MRVLAIEREQSTVDPERHRDVLREEARCVWSLQKQEVIREIWFTHRGCRAVVLLECGSEAEALRHLASLPLFREGLIAFDVIPLRSYDGFDRLIAPGIGDLEGRTPAPEA